MIITNKKISILTLFFFILLISSCSTDKVEQETWSLFTSNSSDPSASNIENKSDIGLGINKEDSQDEGTVTQIGNGKILIESEGQNVIEIELLGDSNIPATTNWGDGCKGQIISKSFHAYDIHDNRNMEMDAPNSSGIKLSSLSGVKTIDLSDY